MKEIVLITGAGGSVAKALAKKLENEYSVRFLTRTKNMKMILNGISKTRQ